MRRCPPLLAAVLAGATGCSALLWETGLPWTQAEFRVERVDRRGPFLDVLVAADIERRFFTRATDECVGMLEPGAQVKLKHTDFFGPFAQGDAECRVAGIGNLEDFRSSRSRGGYGRGPIRSSPERIEIVYEDEEYLYARGGFSIAGVFGWSPGTDQVVALLPKVPECARLAGGGTVSAVYRQAGRPALGLAVGDGLCPVSGVFGVDPGDFAG